MIRHRIAAVCLTLLAFACQEDTKPSGDTENDMLPDMADAAVAAVDAAIVIDAKVTDAATPDMAGPCETNDDCESGLCEEGMCVPTECSGDNDCPAPMLQTCRDFVCRDRCLQDRCLRGGVCIDGACVPEQCTVDGDCEDGELCREGRCVEAQPCEENVDCEPDGRCIEGNCEPLTVCAGDRNCAEDEICDDGLCRPQPTCEERADCGEGLDCVAARCVPFVCRGPVDCGEGEVCRGGACVEPEVAAVAEVFILTRPRAINIGEQLQFRAVGVDLRGDVVAVDGFEWASEGPGVMEGATLTGGPEVGEVVITAAYDGSDGRIVSDPVAIQVIDLAPAEGGRVRLTDATTGRPIEGATVRVADEDMASDADGVVLFEADGPVTLSVFADGYAYLTLVEVNPTDLRLALEPRVVDDRVAGFTGTLDFDEVMQDGEVDLGLAGAAFTGGLTHIGFQALLGDIFNTEVNAGPANFDLPLPGGLTLAADVPILGRLEVKEDYYVTGGAGFQFAWAFAGRIDFNTLLALFGGGGGGGGGGFNVGQVLAQLLPFFDRFNHGLRVDELVALPTLPDADDIDGDGDDQELVPDYERFVSLDVEPAQPQQLRVGVDVPAPELPGDGTPVALVFAGTEVDGVGFVPLGISATDEGELIPMRQAAPYGGLEVGDPVILSLAARFGGGSFLPGEISARMARFDRNLPPEVALQSFLTPSEGATWDPALRRIDAGVVDGADVHRVVFDGPAGRWTVYFSGVPEFTLPFPPDGAADLSAGGTVRVEGLDLTVDFDDLIGPAAGELPDVDQRTGGFSRAIAE